MIGFACAVILCWLATKEVEGEYPRMQTLDENTIPEVHPFFLYIPTALTCACTTCPEGVCNAPDVGSCFAKLTIVNNVQMGPIARHCYDTAHDSQLFCGTDVTMPVNGTNLWTYLKIECCDDRDQCNKDLSPVKTSEYVPSSERCARARPISRCFLLAEMVTCEFFFWRLSNC